MEMACEIYLFADRCCIAALSLVALSVHVAVAWGAQTSYCGILVDPHSSCTSTAYGRYKQNAAVYPGSGTVRVCQKAISQQGILDSRTCGNNRTQSDADLFGVYNAGNSVTLYVGNDSSARHTVNGTGVY